MKEKTCHYKFSEMIKYALLNGPMDTQSLYGEAMKVAPECVTEEKCYHRGMGGTWTDFEWQHNVRRAQQHLQRKNVIRRIQHKWFLVGVEENIDLLEIEFLHDVIKNDPLEEIRRKLKETTPASPEYVWFNGRRYKRDNATIAMLKVLREFKCQMCQKQIRKKSGGFYIEGAHILEKRKGGTEVPENILILCPNHHKEFDYGKRSKVDRNGDYIEFELNGEHYQISVAI